MTIEVTISQRCGGEYGQPVYFAADCTATFSLDGNADNAQMMAGYAVAGMVRAHMGDTLLVAIKLNGKLVARWVGEATDFAADEFQAFMGGRMMDFWPFARRIAQNAANDKSGLLEQARELAAFNLERQAVDYREANGASSIVAALFMAKAQQVRRGKHDGDSVVVSAISAILMAESSRREFPCTEA